MRAEPRAAKRREAGKAIEKMHQTSALRTLLGEADDILDGSPNAQAMWLLKNRMSDAIEEKGSAEKVRQNVAADLALDYLVVLGVLDGERRHEAQTRRQRKALLSEFEGAFGTATEIISEPDARAREYLERARKQREADDHAADLARAEADRQADAERTRLDREAAAERKRLAEQNRTAAERRKRKFAAREAFLTERETAIETRSAQLDAREEKLTKREQFVAYLIDSYGVWMTKIRKAAGKLGLLDDPVVSDALTIEDGLVEAKRRQPQR